MWESEQKKYIIIKTVLVLCFFGGLVILFSLVESWQKKQAVETAAIKTDEGGEVASLSSLNGEISPEGSTEGKRTGANVKAPMEIVNNIILTDVPAADYSFSFERQLDGAKVVTRQGDFEGFNEGTYPEENTEKEPVFTEGVEGYAIYLDGSYGIELCDIAPLSDSYTISFWMKAEEIYDWSPFLMIGSNLLDANVSQNYLCFNKKTTEEGEEVLPIFNTINDTLGYSCEVRPSFEDKKCIDLNEWNYITIRVDGTQVSETDEVRVAAYLYLNSEMIGLGEVCKMSFDEENMKAYIGINCYDMLFRVAYDEIHIWNCVLNEHQISSMYIAYITGNQK